MFSVNGSGGRCSLDNMVPADKEKYLSQSCEDLKRSVNGVSALGEFQKPLEELLNLVKLEEGAKALVNHPSWLPNVVNGRDIELDSILGPFFHVSALPDDQIFKSQPDVGEHIYLHNSSKTITARINSLHDGLEKVLHCLLKNTNTRENVLDYLADVINKNSSKARMQVELYTCASSGTFVNLSSVMLLLLKPNANFTKRDKIDPKYVLKNTRLKFKGLTVLNASLSTSPVQKWLDNNHGEVSKFELICEVFFMTARVLNLGLIKGISHYEHLVKENKSCLYTLSSLKTEQKAGFDPQLQQDISRLEEELKVISQEKLCYEAQILQDGRFLGNALCFYRLMVVWMVDLVGICTLPVSEAYPKDLAAMPEHFVDDAMEFLLFASKIPNFLNASLLEDFVNFIVRLMAAPEYIRNPYLRGKMVKVLHIWMPRESGYSSVGTTLFRGHQLSLVRNLLKVYIDMELTGATQSYKFDIRHKISKLLEYLWDIPNHRDVWRQIAKEEEKGIYLNFLNFLINDSIYILDESLTKILELKKLEDTQTADSVDFEDNIRELVKLANQNLSTLAYTSEKITTPFLRPEVVERVASILNYFLLKFVGPQKECLNLKDPKKYEFDPNSILEQIVNIYIHLARGDKANIFVAAIVKDGRSYSEELFRQASKVLSEISPFTSVIKEFVELKRKVKVAATKELEMEAVLGEIPDEFLDPIQYTLMMDPVILPSTGITIDRPVIERHLLSYNTDPFNRSPLTIDMLKSDTTLKAQINEFIKSRELKKKKDGEDCNYFM